MLPMLRRSSGACQIWNVLFIATRLSIRHLAVMMLWHVPQLCPRCSHVHTATHLFQIYLHFPLAVTFDLLIGISECSALNVYL
jgi:hypothetical protein